MAALLTHLHLQLENGAYLFLFLDTHTHKKHEWHQSPHTWLKSGVLYRLSIFPLWVWLPCAGLASPSCSGRGLGPRRKVGPEEQLGVVCERWLGEHSAQFSYSLTREKMFLVVFGPWCHLI